MIASLRVSGYTEALKICVALNLEMRMVNKDAWLDLILILKKVAVTSEVRKEQEYETKSNRQKVT